MVSLFIISLNVADPINNIKSELTVNGKPLNAHGLENLILLSCQHQVHLQFAEIDKLILKLIWKFKRPSIAKMIFKKEDKVGGLTLSHLKTYYIPLVIKIAWNWHKYILME